MDIAAAIAQLERNQLVRRSEGLDTAYVFNHALTQETVYKSLLKPQRQHLHYSVADAIEKLNPGRLDELSNVLAFHWQAANEPERAHPYLVHAAEQAARRFANSEALELFGRALATGVSVSPEELMRIRIERAEIYEFLSQYALALQDYATLLEDARRLGRLADECLILSRIAWLEWLSGHGERAVSIATEAESKSHLVQDPSLALRAYLVRGLVAQAQGNISDAYPRLRRALTSSRKLNARALEGESLFFLGIQNNFMGRFGRAAAFARKAYAIKASLGDRAGEIVSLYLLARAEAGRGRYDQALAALENGLIVSKETNNPFGLAQYPNTRAWLAAELGDWETAYELDLAGLEIARRAPVRPPEISNLINLVLDCVALRRLDEADRYVVELNKWIGRPEFGFHAWRWQIRFLDARARLLIASALYHEAKDAVQSLAEWSTQTQSYKYLARALMLQGTICIAQKDWMSASRQLIDSIHLADRLNYIPLRLHARIMLAQVREHLGEAEPADQLYQEATQLARQVEGCLTNPELRRMFHVGMNNRIAFRSHSSVTEPLETPNRSTLYDSRSEQWV